MFGRERVCGGAQGALRGRGGGVRGTILRGLPGRKRNSHKDSRIMSASLFTSKEKMTDNREDLLTHLAGLFRVERPRCLHGCLHLMLFGGNVSGSDPLRRDGDRDGVGCKSSRLQHRGSFRLVGSEKKGVVMMVCRRGRGDLRRIEKVDERTRFGSLLSMQRRWAADEQMMNVDSKIIATERRATKRFFHLDRLYIYTLVRSGGKPQSKKSTDDPTRRHT